MRVGIYNPPSPVVFVKGKPYPVTGLVRGKCEDHFVPSYDGAYSGYWESCGDPNAPRPPPRPLPPAPPAPVASRLRGCCGFGDYVEGESGYAPDYDHVAAVTGFSATVLTRAESLVGIALLVLGKGVIRRIGGVLLGSQLGYSLGAVSKCGDNATPAMAGTLIGGYLGWKLSRK